MSTNPFLDPTKAKLAAQIIKNQGVELSTAKEKIAELSKEVEQLNRYQECVKIAHQMSESGRIPKDFGSILEKAASLSESDTKIEIFKAALDMAQSNFELGSIDNSKPSSGRDPFVDVIMSLGA